MHRIARLLLFPLSHLHLLRPLLRKALITKLRRSTRRTSTAPPTPASISISSPTVAG
jgi:hypothetical protein